MKVFLTLVRGLLTLGADGQVSAGAKPEVRFRHSFPAFYPGNASSWFCSGRDHCGLVHKGGLRAQILSEGEIRVGDSLLEVLPGHEPTEARLPF